MRTIDLTPVSFDKLKSISPSSFTSLQKCSKKLLLAKSYKSSILRNHPNSYYGTVLHNLLEKKAKGILSISNFENTFKSEVLRQEEIMKKEGYIQPNLQLSCKNFAAKKLQLKGKIPNQITESKFSSKSKSSAEVIVHNEDRTVFGSIDLIKETPESLELVDFKTGKIINDNGEVKEEYKSQLKLYAYLFYLKIGRFPDTLKIEDLTEYSHIIVCNFEESKELYDQAIEFFKSINSKIANANIVGNPSVDNCKFCTNRPACTEYIDSLHILNVVNDCIDFVQESHVLKNGSTVVKMFSGEYIRDIPDNLNILANEKYGFFNILGNKESRSYRFTSNSQVVRYNIIGDETK